MCYHWKSETDVIVKHGEYLEIMRHCRWWQTRPTGHVRCLVMDADAADFDVTRRRSREKPDQKKTVDIDGEVRHCRLGTKHSYIWFSSKRPILSIMVPKFVLLKIPKQKRL
jgi:hypothetical protein